MKNKAGQFRATILGTFDHLNQKQQKETISWYAALFGTP